jgi:hypothetical protein
MLTVAAKQLNRCKELAEVLVQVELVRLSQLQVDDDPPDGEPPKNPREKYERASSRLAGINTDIKMVKELQNTFCALTSYVRVLPCLYCRFNEGNLSECERWWTAIRTSDRFKW